MNNNSISAYSGYTADIFRYESERAKEVNSSDIKQHFIVEGPIDISYYNRFFNWLNKDVVINTSSTTINEFMNVFVENGYYVSGDAKLAVVRVIEYQYDFGIYNYVGIIDRDQFNDTEILDCLNEEGLKDHLIQADANDLETTLIYCNPCVIINDGIPKDDFLKALYDSYILGIFKAKRNEIEENYFHALDSDSSIFTDDYKACQKEAYRFLLFEISEFSKHDSVLENGLTSFDKIFKSLSEFSYSGYSKIPDFKSFIAKSCKQLCEEMTFENFIAVYNTNKFTKTNLKYLRTINGHDIFSFLKAIDPNIGKYFTKLNNGNSNKAGEGALVTKLFNQFEDFVFYTEMGSKIKEITK